MDENQFKGRFIASSGGIAEKLKNIKAFVFDWDGVFNEGRKDASGSSPFSEVDAMGTNLLRFNHYLRNQQNPFCAIISGERNESSFAFAEREHFHAVYFGVKHKINAIEHICSNAQLLPEDIAFIFDDVLDFSAAKAVGLRIMIGRQQTLLLSEYAHKNNLADYITAYSGGSHGLRETTELLMAVSGFYNETIDFRMQNSLEYKNYLQARNQPVPEFFQSDELRSVKR
ncbi:MAG: phosphatase [Terrimonas sp.]|nr:phosphatase [Terrimonas sp.]